MSCDQARADGELVVAPISTLELSGLARVRDQALLEHRGWDVGFWSVDDERSIDNAIVLIGHRADAEHRRDPKRRRSGWQLEEFNCARWHNERPTWKDASDSEAVAHHDGFVYIIGSHFGSKDGPLQRKRAFVARFREDEVAPPGQRGGILQVAHNDFRLHREINDALHRPPPSLTKVSLLPLTPTARQMFIGQTQHDSSLARLVRDDDSPISIEGLAFRSNGTALLGLRFPVDSQGHPLIVEIPSFGEAIFSDSGLTVSRVWVVTQADAPDRAFGVRDLDSESESASQGETVSIIVGGIGKEFARDTEEDAYAGSDDDSSPDESFEHWRTTLADTAKGGPVGATRLRRLVRQGHVEGVAEWPEVGYAYVADTDSPAIQFYEPP